jgi:SAM-dependent MidA family methyltransferase
MLARIARHGPVRFDEVMQAALYDGEAGFYATVGQAGRRGDFLTSVEVGPLFGAVLARALDAWWEEAGSPHPFVVVEAGAGSGTLARAVLHAQPRCREALRYVLVERSARLRAAHADGLPLALPAHAFATSAGSDEEEEPAPTTAPAGPIAVSLDALPPPGTAHLVLANELLDNLPVRLLERADEGWAEVWVGADGNRLVEILLPAGDLPLAPHAGIGARVAWQRHAVQWVADALEVAERVVVVDYATTTDAMAQRPWREWLRTYRGHAAGSGPLVDLGSQDITCEVAVDQLAAVREPDRVRPQSEFLRAHGLDDLVARGRAAWEAGAATGGLDAMRGRSRIGEAEALTDPSGLGAFSVIEWRSR